jgi:hypothetical protein
MEEEQGSGWLGLWILVPLVLLVVNFLAIPLLPDSDCDATTDNGGDPGRVAFALVAGVCSLITGAAALRRTVVMWRLAAYEQRDLWLGGLALLALAIGAGIGGSGEAALGGFLLAGLALMAVSLLTLIVAAFMRRDTDDVGALVPIYLFGACLAYPLFAWVLLDLNSHPLC